MLTKNFLKKIIKLINNKTIVYLKIVSDSEIWNRIGSWLIETNLDHNLLKLLNVSLFLEACFQKIAKMSINRKTFFRETGKYCLKM